MNAWLGRPYSAGWRASETTDRAAADCETALGAADEVPVDSAKTTQARRPDARWPGDQALRVLAEEQRLELPNAEGREGRDVGTPEQRYSNAVAGAGEFMMQQAEARWDEVHRSTTDGKALGKMAFAFV